jgi:cyclophilin family peptidyl-prolyl cis-trans isomerase/uncharacterized caspase-like protein
MALALCAQGVPPPKDTRTLRPQQAGLPGTERRLALVIGNDGYQHVGALRNARADAQAMAKGLEATGFSTTLRLDVSEKELKAALRTFKSQLQGGDVVVFFFSGHGVQLGGANYLLPIDIRGDSEDQVKDEAIPLQRVLDDLQEQKAKFSLAILDACRNNPFKSTGRALGGRGLAPTTAATGQMVLFSAGAGQQALDSLGGQDRNANGLFTRVLLKEMRKPGVSVDRVLRNVRTEVVKLARGVGHEQVPALYDQALGEFFFVPSSPAGDTAMAVQPEGETGLAPAPVVAALVGGLQVSVNAQDAKVFLDGAWKGDASPTRALNLPDLPVGECRLRVVAPGYEPLEKGFEVQKGRWTQAEMVLTRPVVASPQPASEASRPLVVMKTSLGEIRIRLFQDKVPDTVNNFLGYVNDRFYDGTIFHRVINRFMVQGGGYTAGLEKKATKAPIRLEDQAGLFNRAGTVAMARMADPHSATAQFFINLVDNPALDPTPSGRSGYAVFGEVVSGMEVVYKIMAVKTGQKSGMSDVPSQPVLIESVQVAKGSEPSSATRRPRQY